MTRAFCRGIQALTRCYAAPYHAPLKLIADPSFGGAAKCQKGEPNEDHRPRCYDAGRHRGAVCYRPGRKRLTGRISGSDCSRHERVGDNRKIGVALPQGEARNLSIADEILIAVGEKQRKRSPIQQFIAGRGNAC